MPNLSRRRITLPRVRHAVLAIGLPLAGISVVACGDDSAQTPADSLPGGGPGAIAGGGGPGAIAGGGGSGDVTIGGGPGDIAGGGLGAMPALTPVVPPTEEECAGDGVFPGLTELRRLSNPEYTNTLEDLLGVYTADVDLVPDALTQNTVVSPEHATKYLTAANEFAAAARGAGKFKLPCAAEAEACATSYIKEFGAQAFRRPLADDEVASYLARFKLGAEGGFEEGLEWVVGRMLQSPHFIHRIELEGGSDATKGIPVALDSYSVATRISYFLWQTMPDAELRAAAAAGTLTDETAVAAQVDRMIASPRFDSALDSFHDRWLEVRSVLAKQKAGESTPPWTGDLKLDMVEEVQRFVGHVYKSGGTFTELMTAKYSFLSPRLAELYEVAHPGGDWPKVDAVPNRYGLLTMAGFTASHASEIQSSPVKRGAWIRTHLLCDNLPDPPTNLGEITEPEVVEGQSTAQAFAAHRQDPRCAGCHIPIDPLGLPFENYDRFGRYRTMDRGTAVVASGELTATGAEAVNIDPVVSGPEDFATKFAQLPKAQACAVKKWVEFGIGRTADEKGTDRCTVSAVSDRFKKSDLNLKELIVALATSDAFRYRINQ